MSLHVPTNPEIKARLRAQMRNTTISSIIIALLILALLVAALWMISLTSFLKNTEELVTYSAASESTEQIVKPEMNTEITKKPSPPSSNMSQVISTNTPSPTAVSVPDIAISEPAIDFGNSDDFGGGWGSDAGNAGGSEAAGGMSTPFGKTGGEGMKGAFYDLKQTPKKELTKLGKFYIKSRKGRIQEFRDEILSLNRGKFSESKLSKFFKANLELTFTHMVMPSSKADAAPKAFGVEKEVEPSGWIVIYEGTLEESAPAKVRFSGRYDDLLLVCINDRVVFDGSWVDHSGQFDKGEDVPGPSLLNVPLRRNQRFMSLEKGDHIRLVFGESPGGQVGGGLLVEEEGKSYKKNSAGEPILPPFCTQALDSDDIKKLKALKYPVELSDVPIFKIN